MKFQSVGLLLSMVMLAASSATAADLTTDLVQEISSPDQAKAQALSQKLSKYQIVFGQLTDQQKIGVVAFADHTQELAKLGAHTPSMVGASIYTPYDTNAETLHTQLADIYEQNGHRPLILIGNPGMGPEFLYTALKYPDLVQSGAIGKIVMIFPVFGLPFLKDRQEWANLVSKCTNSLTEPVCKPVTEFLDGKAAKLDPIKSRATFEDLIRQASTTVVSREGEAPVTLAQALSKSVYYVRGGVKAYDYVPTGFTEEAHVPSKILKYYLINKSLSKGRITDSMTYAEDQILRDDTQISSDANESEAPVFGTDLTASGPLNLSHWDLFSQTFVNTPAELRTAFTRAMLSEILDVRSLSVKEGQEQSKVESSLNNIEVKSQALCMASGLMH
jgi:hypothetical protein